MGERAALLEDAVARLADQRLRGETVLRLNEAEFLLLLGAERLRLFGDPASAIQAFTLAEASLGSLDDPALATLRQTLAQELIELRTVPPDPRPQLRAELSMLAQTLAALPASREDEIVATSSRDSRLARLLSQLVTVRRVAERDAVLGPVQRDAALAAVRLQIELAQAALARPDPAAFHAALEQIAASSERLFDRRNAATVDYFAALDRLQAAELVPTLPALGATLQELRGLRATRSIGQDAAAPAALPATSTPGEAAPASTPAAPEPLPSTPPLPEVERTPSDDSDGAGGVE
nr:uroporphyrinogen-III C-methyltransferase [Chiayiivirga flava]